MHVQWIYLQHLRTHSFLVSSVFTQICTLKPLTLCPCPAGGCHVVPSASNGTTNMSSSFLRLSCGQPSFARPEQTGPGAARGVLVAPFAITGVVWLALMAGQPLSLDLHHMIVALLSPLLQQALPMAPDGQFLLSTSPLSPSLSLARARFPSPHPSPARRPVSPVRVRH